MRIMSVCAVSVFAGMACSAAMGQEALRYGGTIKPLFMVYNGQVYPVGTGAGADVPEVVYDNGILIPPVNTPTSGAFTTASLPKNNLMDEVSFSPGPGAGQGVLLTSAVINIATGTGNPPVVTLPFDAIAVQMRVWDTITPANPVVTSDLRGDVTLIFDAPLGVGWEGGFYYVSDPIDLTTLPGGGIQTSDDAIGFGLNYLTTMLDPVTQLPVATTTPHPDASTAFADFSGPVTIAVGSSFETYWRDADANGEFNATDLRGFAAPTVANFIMSLTGEVGGGGTCYPNCDNSTQAPILNVADFTCFLQRFAAGESYANCDNSTLQPVLNVADFTCFLQSFAAGCP